MLCTCRACFLLFTHEGAAQGRSLEVPNHSQPIRTQQAWDDIPAPGLHGLLLPELLHRVTRPSLAAPPALRSPSWTSRPGTACWQRSGDGDGGHRRRSVVVRRTDGAFECFLVPFDACCSARGRGGAGLERIPMAANHRVFVQHPPPGAAWGGRGAERAARWRPDGRHDRGWLSTGRSASESSPRPRCWARPCPEPASATNWTRAAVSMQIQGRHGAASDDASGEQFLMVSARVLAGARP